MRLTAKLVRYLHRVFEREPMRVLALRLNYTGAMTWTVADGVLTTSVSGVNLNVPLASHTIASLATYLAAQPGYSVPYSNADYAARSAMAVLDATNTISVSNGDHLYLYESLLWVYLDAVSLALTQAKLSIATMVQQMDARTAVGEWLDEWGSYFGIRRITSEGDPTYSTRMVGELFSVRSNNRALETVIKNQAGLVVSVTDVDWWPRPREVQLVQPPTLNNFDYSGADVSLSENGKVLVASRWGDDQYGSSAGAADLHERVDGLFVFRKKVFAPTPSVDDNMGSAVAVSGDGNTILVAANTYRYGVGNTDRGAVFVFVKQSGEWVIQATLSPPEIINGDKFGWAIGISRDGNTVVATSPFHANGGTQRGAGWIFNRSGSSWTVTQKLSASDAVDAHQFGYNVALSKDGLVCFLGAPIANLSGAVYAYEKVAGVWTQVQKITEAVPVASNYFGVGWGEVPSAVPYHALACSQTGDYLVAGAWGTPGGGTRRGQCLVFLRTSTWTVQQTVTAPTPTDEHYFASDVTMSDAGDAIIIGAQGEDVPLVNCGAAYYLRRIGAVWGTAVRIVAQQPITSAAFGYRCFLRGDGSEAAISASTYGVTGTYQGAVYLLGLSSYSVLKKLGLDSGVAPGTPPAGGYPYWGLQANNNKMVCTFAVLINASLASLSQATKDTIKAAVERNRAAGTYPRYYVLTGTLLIANTAANNTNNLTYLSAPLTATYQQVTL